MVTWLGSNWGEGERPRYAQERICETVKRFSENGVPVTYDIPVAKNGDIGKEFLELLHNARKHIGG